MGKLFVFVANHYGITSLLEISIYGLFIYFVLRKTKREVNRRWKASFCISVAVGLAILLFFETLYWIGWLMRVRFDTFWIDLLHELTLTVPAFLAMMALIIMPIMIFGTIIAYYRFLNSGDDLIEKYWRNPKIHYGDGKKPPFG